MAAPVHRGAIIAGKMIAYMGVVCLQVLVFFTIGNGVFGMALGHSPLGLVLPALALAAAGLGMLVAALARSSRQAENLGMVLGFVLAAVAIQVRVLYLLGCSLYSRLHMLTECPIRISPASGTMPIRATTSVESNVVADPVSTTRSDTSTWRS